MTLNEWEQSNIEVLTSREMGEWLSRRENRLLDKIRAEIDGIEINGQVDEHTMFIRSGEQVKQMTLDIIDKYKAESEE